MGNTLEFQYDAPAVYVAEECINKFEADAAEHIAGLTRQDIGGVIIYSGADGEEAASFDYELLSGYVRVDA